MIRSIVTHDTKKEDWSKIKASIKSRIFETFGTSPVGLEPQKNKYKELERYTKDGLEYIKLKCKALCIRLA